MILVSRYPVLTAVNWSQHWCPICVHYQFSCAPKLAKKYEIDCSRSSKTINWSADSFQINHVTSMSWHMSPRYGHGILVSGYPVLTAVNWPYYECPIQKMSTCQDTPEIPLPPFDSLPCPDSSALGKILSHNRISSFFSTPRCRQTHDLGSQINVSNSTNPRLRCSWTHQWK